MRKATRKMRKIHPVSVRIAHAQFFLNPRPVQGANSHPAPQKMLKFEFSQYYHIFLYRWNRQLLTNPTM